LDTDRYTRETKILSEKNHSEKLPKTEQKLKTARDSYNALHGELTQDMEKMIQQRMEMLDQIFTLMVSSQDVFFKAAVNSTNPLIGDVSNVRCRPLSFPHKITPDDRTAATASYTPIAARITGEPRTKVVFSEEVLVTTFTKDDDSGDEEYIPDTNSESEGEEPSKRTKSVPSTFSKAPQVDMKPFKATALYDFQAAETIELSFKEGDVLVITKKKGHWWVAELNGKTGLVPPNFLKVSQ